MASVARLSQKGGFINEELRNVLIAARPWSVPASAVPAALAAAVAWQQSNASLFDVVLPLVVAIAVHFAANTTNTIYDFKKGLDTLERADDRSLVEGRVGLRTLQMLSLVYYAVAAAGAAWYVYQLPDLLWIVVAGFLLAFFYTADPLSLKYLGLGDVTVFLCFGPLLMVSCASVVAGRVWPLPGEPSVPAGAAPAVLWLSLAVGLLTVNILHANNTRDIIPDRAAGARTLPQWLGFTGSYYLYIAQFLVGYAAAVYALALHITSSMAGVQPGDLVAVLRATDAVALLQYTTGAAWGAPAQPLPAAVNKQVLDAAVHWARATVFLVVVTLPWCLVLIRRFAGKLLKELPQATAQFNLLFGTAVLCGVLPFTALARGCLAILFYLGGFNNLLMWAHTRVLVTQKLRHIVPGLPASVGSALALLTSVTQLGASVAFILNWHAREAAWVLASLLLPITLSVHDLWSADYNATAEYVDPEAHAPSTKGSGSGSATTSAKGRRRSVAAVQASPAKADVRKRRASLAPAAVAPAAAAAAAPVAAAVAAHAGDAVPTFWTSFDNEFVHFFKNIGMLGGLLVYLAYTPADM